MSDEDDSLDNDSFEEEPYTVNEMIAHGKKVNATHLLICYDGPKSDPTPVYVFDPRQLDNVVDACYGGCPFVSIIDLNEVV